MSRSKNHPIQKSECGNHSYWHHQEGDQYLVTGVDRDGKRIKPKLFDSWFLAKGINLWCGTKWLVRDGKRYKILTVIN